MNIIMSVSVERQRLPFPRSCPPRLRVLITELWAHTPSQRPNILSVRHSLSEMRREAA